MKGCYDGLIRDLFVEVEMTTGQIAKFCGFPSASYVSYRLTTMGLSRPKKRSATIEHGRLERYLAEGLSYSEIAAKENMSRASVCNIVRQSHQSETSTEMSLMDFLEANCLTNGKVKGVISRAVKEAWWTRRGFNDRLEQLMKETSWLGEAASIPQRIYHVLKGPDTGHCVVCGKSTEFLNFVDGYRRHCSFECSHVSPERIRKIVENTDHAAQAEKVRQTNLLKYGKEHYYQTDDFKEKAKRTKFERYGDPDFRNDEKRQQTCLERYGVTHQWLLEEEQEKCREAKLKKYGTLCFNNSCHSTSAAEIEILEYLNSISEHKFVKSRKILKSGRELDGYCEQLGLAIEHCGLWHHSEKFKDKKYHYEKYMDAKNCGINLITIFEDHWKLRKEQVKQFLAARVGVFDIRIPARKCHFQELVSPHWFFEKYHIQGRPHIKRSFGLIYDGDIVGAVSYSHHHRHSNKTVLNRLAFKSGVQVVGGVGKLLRHSIDRLEVDEIVTWSDNCLSTGDIYRKNGFVLGGLLPPDYFYYRNGRKGRISKQSMKKSNTGCPQHLTEHEWALENQYYRVYDCGKKRWIYQYK